MSFGPCISHSVQYIQRHLATRNRHPVLTDIKSFLRSQAGICPPPPKFRISTAETRILNSSQWSPFLDIKERDQSLFSLFSLRIFRLIWSVFSSVIVEKVLYTHTICQRATQTVRCRVVSLTFYLMWRGWGWTVKLTTMMTVFSRSGIE